MTEREINEKAREIYIRCFDDIGEYVGVINALVIAVRETSRELEAQIEKMKCCGNCKNYSSTYGLCCYSLGDEDYDCRLRKWEIAE